VVVQIAFEPPIEIIPTRLHNDDTPQKLVAAFLATIGNTSDIAGEYLLWRDRLPASRFPRWYVRQKIFVHQNARKTEIDKDNLFDQTGAGRDDKGIFNPLGWGESKDKPIRNGHAGRALRRELKSEGVRAKVIDIPDGWEFGRRSYTESYFSARDRKPVGNDWGIAPFELPNWILARKKAPLTPISHDRWRHGVPEKDPLRIRPKAGGLVPFVLNAAQLELHRRLEAQKTRTGKVRAVILKARQLGCSTYVAGRLLRQTLANHGWQTGIIAHERPASKNLFDLVKRFHENLPDEHRPALGTSNAEALAFDKLDSGYSVSVATMDGSGRSSTLQLLHASEVAYWPSLQEQLSGLVQTIPDVPGTEVILESTGRQFGDEFHQLWRKAEAGESEFEAIFLPWFIDPTYRTPVTEDFVATADERDYATLHKLDDEQILWRRNKIRQLMGSEERFACEYPATPGEAFLASNFDSFIPPALVMAARRATDIAGSGKLVIGCDPAGKGADSTALAWRRGSVIERVERHRGLDTMQITGMLVDVIRRDSPAQVCIDVGGLGVGIYDRLIEQGHSDVGPRSTSAASRSIRCRQTRPAILQRAMPIEGPKCGAIFATPCRKAVSDCRTMMH
jgi:hypothetical protein